MAILDLEIKPKDFWELTPGEFSVYIKAARQKHKDSRMELGIQTWNNGLASNLDYKKMSLNRWLERFEDPEIVKQRKEKELEEGRRLWLECQRRSERRRLKSERPQTS